MHTATILTFASATLFAASFAAPAPEMLKAPAKPAAAGGAAGKPAAGVAGKAVDKSAAGHKSNDSKYAHRDAKGTYRKGACRSDPGKQCKFYNKSGMSKAGRKHFSNKQKKASKDAKAKYASGKGVNAKEAKAAGLSHGSADGIGLAGLTHK